MAFSILCGALDRQPDLGEAGVNTSLRILAPFDYMYYMLCRSMKRQNGDMPEFQAAGYVFLFQAFVMIDIWMTLDLFVRQPLLTQMPKVIYAPLFILLLFGNIWRYYWRKPYQAFRQVWDKDTQKARQLKTVAVYTAWLTVLAFLSIGIVGSCNFR